MSEPPAPRGTPFVGLTGGIAAGKSEALAALERLGAATLSADAVVHELLETAEVRDELVARFGPEIAPEREVDREALAARVFDRPEDRTWLERLLWPRVGERIAAWRSELDRRGDPPVAAIVETPLLFEAGMEAAFDATIAVVANEATRSSRATGRGHAGLESRASRQLGQDEKARRADFVVQNDGDLDELEQALSRLLAKIGR